MDTLKLVTDVVPGLDDDEVLKLLEFVTMEGVSRGLYSMADVALGSGSALNPTGSFEPATPTANELKAVVAKATKRKRGRSKTWMKVVEGVDYTAKVNGYAIIGQAAYRRTIGQLKEGALIVLAGPNPDDGSARPCWLLERKDDGKSATNLIFPDGSNYRIEGVLRLVPTNLGVPMEEVFDALKQRSVPQMKRAA